MNQVLYEKVSTRGEETNIRVRPVSKRSSQNSCGAGMLKEEAQNVKDTNLREQDSPSIALDVKSGGGQGRAIRGWLDSSSPVVLAASLPTHAAIAKGTQGTWLSYPSQDVLQVLSCGPRPQYASEKASSRTT
ncbi:hypothetical protein M378DRAFT_16433 [Amanita muscaria Koide BX008]|uniref:Uncharacterized protein n=1 Tax=Amanita muscaria (strain Koide BX008) TaxID=946122 RepID=A0A0C2ST11_AMAMK|nr:hypothetical protein M378DRAFT_16433 [Amanita muscaria Koide BX008]